MFSLSAITTKRILMLLTFAVLSCGYSIARSQTLHSVKLEDWETVLMAACDGVKPCETVNLLPIVTKVGSAQECLKFGHDSFSEKSNSSAGHGIIQNYHYKNTCDFNVSVFVKIKEQWHELATMRPKTDYGVRVIYHSDQVVNPPTDIMGCKGFAERLNDSKCK